MLIVGVAIVSPLIEELFFRGLLLRAMLDALSSAGRSVAMVVSLIVSTGAFVLLHALPWGRDIPLGLLVASAGVGLACGILTIVTGRLGAAIVAHVTFNGIGVLLLLL